MMEGHTRNGKFHPHTRKVYDISPFVKVCPKCGAINLGSRKEVNGFIDPKIVFEENCHQCHKPLEV